MSKTINIIYVSFVLLFLFRYFFFFFTTHTRPRLWVWFTVCETGWCCAFSLFALVAPPLASLLQKEKRNREVKLRRHQSEFFLVFHCLCPGFRKRVFFGGETRRNLIPINILVQKKCVFVRRRLAGPRRSLVWMNQVRSSSFNVRQSVISQLTFTPDTKSENAELSQTSKDWKEMNVLTAVGAEASFEIILWLLHRFCIFT